MVRAPSSSSPSFPASTQAILSKPEEVSMVYTRVPPSKSAQNGLTTCPSWVVLVLTSRSWSVRPTRLSRNRPNANSRNEGASGSIQTRGRSLSLTVADTLLGPSIVQYSDWAPSGTSMAGTTSSRYTRSISSRSLSSVTTLHVAVVSSPSKPE